MSKNPLQDITAALIAAQAQTPYHSKLDAMAHEAYEQALSDLRAYRDAQEIMRHRLNTIEEHVDLERLSKERGVLSNDAVYIDRCIKDIRACLPPPPKGDAQ